MLVYQRVRQILVVLYLWFMNMRERYIYIYKKPFYGCKIVFMEKTTNMALAVQGDIKLTMLIFQTIVYKMVSTIK